MDINENMLCPICKAKLFTGEVAFCPECGAPHHKECYLGLGHCFYADKHGTPQQWQPPKIEPPKATNSQQNEYTQQSAQQNDANGGYNTDNKYNSNNAKYQQNQSGENPFFKANGIDKNELIDGESAENIAKFVGYNALRYINVFRKMANLKKKVSWNWLGFLLPEYWLISRKCYTPAILISFYSILTSIVSTMAMANTSVQYFIQSGVIESSIKNIILILGVLSFISILLRVFIGLFGDYIYKKKVYSSIKELKQNSTTSDIDFMKVGGVNLFLPILLYFAIYAVSILILNFFVL